MKKVLKKILKILLVIILFIGIFYGISFVRSKMLIDDLLVAIEENDVSRIEELTGQTKSDLIDILDFGFDDGGYFYDQNLKNYSCEIVKNSYDEYYDYNIFTIPYTIKCSYVSVEELLNNGKNINEIFNNIDEYMINALRSDSMIEALGGYYISAAYYGFIPESILKDEAEYEGELIEGYDTIEYNLLTQKFTIEPIYLLRKGLGLSWQALAEFYKITNDAWDENVDYINLYKLDEKIEIQLYDNKFVGIRAENESEYLNDKIKYFILNDFNKEEVLKNMMEDGYTLEN